MAIKKINRISDLVKHFKSDIKESWGSPWYRGQSDESWSLLSSFDRLKNPPTETSLVNKFRQNASYLMDRQKPSSHFEWLFMMQHYGVPTRLLDWTENPLMSLYFAVNSESKKDAVLWVLSPNKLNLNSFDNSDGSIPAFEDLDYLGSYTTEKYDKGTDKGILPIAAIATRNNPRIQAQMGVFTISHREKLSIDDVGDKKHIKKYLIPKESKVTLKKELALLGITKFTVFPELSSIGEVLKGTLS